MKYIIKNCPNCWTYKRPKAVCGLTYERSGFKGESESYRYCKNEEKCLLKQIVGLCKIYKNMNATTTEDYARREVALKILQLLEIEEVNEE